MKQATDRKPKEKLQWLPFAITAFCAIITLLIYACSAPQPDYVVFLQVIVAALIPAILPLLSCITQSAYPVFLNLLFSAHVIFAVDLGCAMSFYDRFYWWDIFMHSFFGFIASAGFYVLLLKWNGAYLKRFGFYALIFLSTMGCAAIWEVFEFSCDQLLQLDAQRVMESISLGHTPVYDTMVDMIVAIAGIIVFYATVFFDHLREKKSGRSFYGTFAIADSYPYIHSVDNSH